VADPEPTQTGTGQSRQGESLQAESLRGQSLRADCCNCVGLCCVALAFARSADFAFSKEAGDPCPHLQPTFGCDIHPVLRDRGFKGCTVFDCLGAGQKVTQQTFGGRSWGSEPQSRELMFATFQVMRPLQELLWYLHEASNRPEAAALRSQLVRAYREIEQLTLGSAEDVIGIDVTAHRKQVNVLLRHVSKAVRAEACRGRRHSKTFRRASPGADLVGASLAGENMRGADLRGAHLMGADLRNTDLRGADLIGADVRDVDFSGAQLSGALFLTQFQVNATKGDQLTTLSGSLLRPSHWR
jgi:hypothetical protein